MSRIATLGGFGQGWVRCFGSVVGEHGLVLLFCCVNAVPQAPLFAGQETWFALLCSPVAQVHIGSMLVWLEHGVER